MNRAGQEAEVFALAANWRQTVLTALRPHIGGAVLEVGAGAGETARALRPQLEAESWLCLERDPALADRVAAAAQAGELGSAVTSLCGTIADLPAGAQFDTIVYVDALALAAARLRPGGTLVVMGPAFPVLYSGFDRAMGRHRRHTLASLKAIAPAGLAERAGFYLDAVGLLASAANRLLLRQSRPTRTQVLAWDRLLVPLSRLADPLLGPNLGRSVVMVWQAPGGPVRPLARGGPDRGTVLRFGLVGVTATLTYLAVSLLLVGAGWLPQLANIAAFAVGTAVSYFGHYLFTYRATGSHRRVSARFGAMTLVLVALCSALHEAALLAGAAPWLASLLVTFAYPPLSFLINTFWVYADEVPS